MYSYIRELITGYSGAALRLPPEFFLAIKNSDHNEAGSFHDFTWSNLIKLC